MLQASEGKGNADQVDGVERRVISVSDTKKNCKHEGDKNETRPHLERHEEIEQEIVVRK
jgi:hypothetical protein